MTIEELREKINPVLKKHGVRRAGIFGSTIKLTAKEDSDVDILIDFGPQKISLLDYVGIKLELEDILGRKVDLVEYSTLKPLIKNSILAEEVPILWKEM